ncbi:MAG: hypothetical protein HUJ56_10970 [Erysipelotrichaceae bacterium]|nr:hypothetical protein [Erysipelotrichaceae bacterium]
MIDTIFRSMKKDYDRALYYWFVLMVATMMMYMFFKLACSVELGGTFFSNNVDDNNFAMYLTFFNVTLCMIIMLMANDFYMKKKSRELAILLVCGCTYVDLVTFLLMQTLILLATAIPIGLGLGKLCFPFVNWIMSVLSNETVVIHSTSEALGGMCFTLIFEIVWIILFNLSFCYQSSINTFIHDDVKPSQALKIGFTSKKWFQFLNIIFPMVYGYCAYVLYHSWDNGNKMINCSIIGVVALAFTIVNVICPFLKKFNFSLFGSNPKKLAYMGFFREDLKLIRYYLALFVVTSIALTTIIVSVKDNSGHLALIILSFIMLLPLMSLALMFRFITEMSRRVKTFYTLDKWGFLASEQKSVVLHETVLLFGFIALVSLVYIIAGLTTLYQHRLISIVVVEIVLSAFSIPLVVVGIISYVFYRKTVIA